METASDSAFFNQVWPEIVNVKNGISLLSLILSAFFGGLFAGLWSNWFESNRRIKDRRTDKYVEHRNTIVQIEHESIPLRVNISRNIEAIGNAIANTYEKPTEIKIRFILRLYELKLSTGLGLKLLSVDFINKYSHLYADIETFNSDIKYLSSMVSMVLEDRKKGLAQPDLYESYKELLPVLKDTIEDIDKKSLELLTYAKVAIDTQDKKIGEKYIKDGKEVKYTIDINLLKQKTDKIKKRRRL
jgi:hypothetical protein